MKIIPVIHFVSKEQALLNAITAKKSGCDTVMLIDMYGTRTKEVYDSISIIKEVGLKVGVNTLALSPFEAVKTHALVGADMTWTDICCTHTNQKWVSPEIPDNHMVFTGVAFKYQQYEPDPVGAAVRAYEAGMIPTFSGKATGVAMSGDLMNIMADPRLIGIPKAIASGVDADNAKEHSRLFQYAFVASSVTDNRELIVEDLLVHLIAESQCGEST